MLKIKKVIFNSFYPLFYTINSFGGLVFSLCLKTYFITLHYFAQCWILVNSLVLYPWPVPPFIISRGYGTPPPPRRCSTLLPSSPGVLVFPSASPHSLISDCSSKAIKVQDERGRGRTAASGRLEGTTRQPGRLDSVKPVELVLN